MAGDRILHLLSKCVCAGTRQGTCVQGFPPSFPPSPSKAMLVFVAVAVIVVIEADAQSLSAADLEALSKWRTCPWGDVLCLQDVCLGQDELLSVPCRHGMSFMFYHEMTHAGVQN